MQGHTVFQKQVVDKTPVVPSRSSNDFGMQEPGTDYSDDYNNQGQGQVQSQGDYYGDYYSQPPRQPAPLRQPAPPRQPAPLNAAPLNAASLNAAPLRQLAPPRQPVYEDYGTDYSNDADLIQNEEEVQEGATPANQLMEEYEEFSPTVGEDGEREKITTVVFLFFLIG